MKILMVCLGNICRSPLAEGILQKKIREKNLSWHVDSAGTGSFHIGSKPDPRSVATAKKNQIDITGQRARQFSTSDFEKFDLILAMDRSNYRNLQDLAITPEESEKIKMIMNYVFPDENRPVPDPYWDDDGFEQVYKMLDKACEKLIETESKS